MTDGVARSFALLTAGNLLSPAFSMVLVLAISRLRGVEMLGKYSLVMTVFVVGQSCASLGLPVVLTREIARARNVAGRYFVTATLLASLLVAIALVPLLPATWWLWSEGEMRVALSLALLTFLPSVAMANGESLFLAYGRAGDLVGITLAENVARAVLGTALVLLGFGIVALAVLVLGLRLLAVAALVVTFLRRGVSFRNAVDVGLGRALVREIPVVGAIPIVNQLYARADVFLLTWLGTWYDVGLYSAGLRLVELARTIPAAYGKAFYPSLARLRGRDAEFAAATRRSVRHVLVLVAPLTFVLSGFASILVPAIYGAEAAAGGASLAVLAWSLLPLGLACVLAQVLFATGRQSTDLAVNVIATVVSVAGNLLLIPRFGAVGAAMAMVVATALYAALQYWFIRTRELDPALPRFVTKVLAVSAAGTAASLAVTAANPIAAAALGGATFVGGMVLFGIVSREDIGAVRDRLASSGRVQ